jgi:hypothetical protein
MLQSRRPLAGLLLVLAMIIARPAGAQQQIVMRGTVRSDDGVPLTSASVVINGMGLGAITKDDGHYEFVVPASRVKGQTVWLSARLIGYAMDTALVRLEGDTVQSDFVLISRPMVMGAIVEVGPDSDNTESKEIDDEYGFQYSDALKSARLTDLPAVRHAPGEREIRVWIGVSIGMPKQLYRLVKRDGIVKGEMIYHWEWTSNADSGAWAVDRRRLRATALEWCTNVNFEGETWTCRAKFLPEPKWDEVWSRLESSGIFGPHDYSLTKSQFYVQNDGIEFTVEYWNGRAYHRWTPRPGNSAKELDRGDAIMKFVWHLGSNAVPHR